MHWSDCKNADEIINNLRKGHQIDFDYDITYPLTFLDEGSYAACFRDENGIVIRVSRSYDIDNYTDALSNCSSSLPTVFKPMTGPRCHITIRPDVKCIDRSVLTGHTITVSIPDAFKTIKGKENQNFRTYGNNYAIAKNAIENIFGRNPPDQDKKFCEQLIKSYADFHTGKMSWEDLEKNQYSLFNEYCTGNKYYFSHSSRVNFNALCKWYKKPKSEMYDYLSLCHILAQPHNFDFICEFMRVCTQYHVDFGVAPTDLQISNLGREGKRLVIRDAYNSIQTESEFDSIIRYRVGKGMSLPEDLITQYKPLRINPDVCWLATQYEAIWVNDTPIYEADGEFLIVNQNSGVGEVIRHMKSICDDFEALPEYKRRTTIDEIRRFLDTDNFELADVCIFRIPKITSSANIHHISDFISGLNREIKKNGIEFLDTFMEMLENDDNTKYDILVGKYHDALMENPYVCNALLRLYDEFGVLPVIFKAENLIDGKICDLEFGNGVMADRLNKNMAAKNMAFLPTL